MSCQSRRKHEYTLGRGRKTKSIGGFELHGNTTKQAFIKRVHRALKGIPRHATIYTHDFPLFANVERSFSSNGVARFRGFFFHDFLLRKDRQTMHLIIILRPVWSRPQNLFHHISSSSYPSSTIRSSGGIAFLLEMNAYWLFRRLTESKNTCTCSAASRLTWSYRGSWRISLDALHSSEWTWLVYQSLETMYCLNVRWNPTFSRESRS